MNVRKKPATASMGDVLQWFRDGIFHIQGTEIYKGKRILTQRVLRRNRMSDGDLRVDIYHLGMRRSCLVSHIMWTVTSNRLIPQDFQIHHIDEDTHNNNFENLMIVYKSDHPKLHKVKIDDVPF